MVFKYILICILGYTMGNFATSYIIAKYKADIDIREHGSGNAGATNTLRVLGKKLGAIVFVGDVLKGILAVVIGGYLGSDMGRVLAGIFVVIGHNWPIVLGFKGGKGVSTSLGVLLAINPLIGSIMFVFCIAIMAITKYVSLGSILGMIIFPIIMYFTHQPKEFIILSIIIAVMSIYKHRANIVRLMNGTESKFGSKKKSE